MKQPTLLDVPKDAPSRRERVEAFKKQHNIWTHSAGGKFGQSEPWSALLVSAAQELAKRHGDNYTEPFDLIAGYCRVLDESDLLVTGPTEREAIRTLCERNDIPCPL